MPDFCAQHPQVAALYRCQGCHRPLCEECIEESHALLLCRLCGEQALPLGAGGPATPKELRKQRALSAPYSFRQALLYPFRGAGLYGYLGALVYMMFLWFLGQLIFLCLVNLAFRVIFVLLMVGLQFRIVRSTAEGDNELPDWPDFTDVGGLGRDLLTWIAIHFVLGAVMVGYVVLSGLSGGINLEPNYLFCLGFAISLWLGVAFTVMAYGAAGTFSRLRSLAFHNHIRGFLAAGSDAVVATNMVFALGAVILIVRSLLEAIPLLLGAALSSALGTYWLLTLPHLAGLVFRRHSETMERFYWYELS